jgi:sporulation protein YlmC with PRC-barrel domain
VFSWPYYGVGARLAPFHLGNSQQAVTYHSIPLGEVEILRGEPVHATDGDIGRVQGLVIDPRNHHVTHVLLQEGHRWGRKQVAIPVSAVASTGDGIRLKITKQEVQDLPPVDIDHPDGAPAGGQDTGDRSGH